MSCSGIKISDEIKKTHEALSVDTKKGKRVKYMLLSFNDDGSKLEIESCPEKTDPDILTFDQLIESLPSDDVRFIVYRYFFDVKNSDVVLITWCGESSPIRRKMLLSSTTNTLKSSLGIGSKHIHCENASEITKEIVLKKVGGKELVENP